MKVPINILFGILVVVFTLFCFGFRVCTNYGVLLHSMEQSSGTTNPDNNRVLAVDSIDDDQFLYPQESRSILESLVFISTKQTCFTFFSIYLPIWQPPKLV
jgi:hypothetical protein